MGKRNVVIAASMALLAVVGVVVGLVLSTGGSAEADPPKAPGPTIPVVPVTQLFVYPVKFLCGSVPGEPFTLPPPDQSFPFEPNLGYAAIEPPVKPGNYATAINIYNYQNTEVRFTKKSVIAQPQGEPRGRVSGTVREVLNPGEALEVDCPNIAEMFAPFPEPYKDIQTFTAGEDDPVAFALPTEPTSPSPALRAILGGPGRQFDETGVDKKFGHTFKDLPTCIQSANLHIRLKALGTNEAGSSGDDTLNLGLKPDSSFVDTRYIWNPPHPPDTTSHGYPFSVFHADPLTLAPQVVDHMNDYGTLDVYVEDDTAVDYMRLEIFVGAPCFIKGFVAIESPADLQVVGVYTAEKMEVVPPGFSSQGGVGTGVGLSMDVEYVTAKQKKGRIEIPDDTAAP